LYLRVCRVSDERPGYLPFNYDLGRDGIRPFRISIP
jgi:hypothetical protein